MAAPAMAVLARRLHINVGLAVRDGDDMVYLESVRFNAKGSQRSVVSGQRVPIELTALGRAWLAVSPQSERQSFMEQLKAKRRKRWRILQKEIIEAAASIERRGYCARHALTLLAASDPCDQRQRNHRRAKGICRCCS